MELKEYAMRTHQGPSLQVNEDSVEIDLAKDLYLLLDGFGGSGIGDYSTKLSLEAILGSYGKFVDDADATMPFFYNNQYRPCGNALVNAFMHAHDRVLKNNEDKPLNRCGGVSAIALANDENLCSLVGVGNCGAFLYRRGKLHTLMQPQNMTFWGGDFHPGYYLTYPTNALGLNQNLTFQHCEYRPLKDDLVLLMSDGVYGHITYGEIEYTLTKNEKHLYTKIDSLFDLANERGNMDNQSTIILSY